jgi:hypothetical protein
MQIYGKFSTCKLFSAVFSKKNAVPSFLFYLSPQIILTKRQNYPTTLDIFLIFKHFTCKILKKYCFFKNFGIKTRRKKKVTEGQKKINPVVEIGTR